MTDRWLALLQQYRSMDLVTVSLAALTCGLMACWFILCTSRLPFIDRHRAAALQLFWVLVLALDLSLFSYLAFCWPKG